MDTNMYVYLESKQEGCHKKKFLRKAYASVWSRLSNLEQQFIEPEKEYYIYKRRNFVK
jgi:hypothetical protein